MSGGESGCEGWGRRRTTRSRMSGKYLPIFSILFQQPLQRIERTTALVKEDEVLVERKEAVVSESVTKRHLGKHYFCIRIRISNRIELALHE